MAPLRRTADLASSRDIILAPSTAIKLGQISTELAIPYVQQRANELQLSREKELKKLREKAEIETAYMAQVLKQSCDPGAAKRLEEAYTIDKLAAESEHVNQMAKLEEDFAISATSAKKYGGKAFELVHGNNETIDAVEHDDNWVPGTRSAVTTGFVQTFTCIPPTHVQAFYTYYLLNKEKYVSLRK